MFRLFISATLLTLLAACSSPVTRPVQPTSALEAEEALKQQEMALQNILTLEARLSSVAYPLLKAASSQCKNNTRKSIGLSIYNQDSFGPKLSAAAHRLLDSDESLRVLHTAAGSPADMAGLQPGDPLIAINRHVAPKGKDAQKRFLETLHNSMNSRRTLTLTYKRNNETHKAEVTPDTLCNYSVKLNMGNELNAYADGKQVFITKGMMRFTDTDQELSLIVAHEIAHNTMKHIEAKKNNFLLGSILDIVAAGYGINTQSLFGKMAAQSYSQEFESEADYVGLYIMAKASLEIEGAANFWRRMAAEHPANIQNTHAASHPATAERFLAIEGAVTEVAQKKEKGRPLEPHYK